MRAKKGLFADHAKSKTSDPEIHEQKKRILKILRAKSVFWYLWQFRECVCLWHSMNVCVCGNSAHVCVCHFWSFHASCRRDGRDEAVASCIHTPIDIRPRGVLTTWPTDFRNVSKPVEANTTNSVFLILIPIMNFAAPNTVPSYRIRTCLCSVDFEESTLLTNTNITLNLSLVKRWLNKKILSNVKISFCKPSLRLRVDKIILFLTTSMQISLLR